MCSIFVFVESLGGIRHVSICEHHTATDWAEEIKYLVFILQPFCTRPLLLMRHAESPENGIIIPQSMEIGYGRDGAQCHDTTMSFVKDSRYWQNYGMN